MSSKILIVESGMGSTVEKRGPRMVSYVINTPVEVLGRFFQTHRILRYGNINLPLDCGTGFNRGFSENYGLIIKKSDAPKGTQIIQALSGINLEVMSGAELLQEDKGTQEELRKAFARAIDESMEYSLDDWGTSSNYLDLYEMRENEGGQIRKYEKRVVQLLEIAKAAFGVENPSVKDLQEFLK